LADTFVFANFVFPNTLETVTEAITLPLTVAIIEVAGSIGMGIVCIFGLSLWCIRHPATAILMSPLTGLIFLNFVVGNRFIFYGTPMFWFGTGYLLTFAASFIYEKIVDKRRSRFGQNTTIIFATALGLAVAWISSPTNYVPRQTFSKETIAGFAMLRDVDKGREAVVATWWDYGYASTLMNQLPVLHYGGAVNSPTTYFVANAFLAQSQVDSLGILKYLSVAGHRGINNQKSVADLESSFAIAANRQSPDLYIVFTNQMAGWLESISKIGNWDIETGQPITLRGNADGPLIDYKMLNCRLTGYPQRLSCSGEVFDLERGLINGIPALSGWAHTKDGVVVRHKRFDNDGNYAVQIVQTGNRINILFMHRQLFHSTFNKLYYLGQIEHPSIKLHYDDFPHIRVYKVSGDSAG
jgi:dolichyl-diphosphooligosaccharide--protein glycosyltransferase